MHQHYSHSIHPKYKQVHVQEIPKTVEIRDSLNRLWYIVELNLDVERMIPGFTLYRVKVYNYKFDEFHRDGIIIVNKPEPPEPSIESYELALSIWNDCVKTYTSYVKAQTRDVQDIDVYAEKINYHIIQPECCQTCKFSRCIHTPQDYSYKMTGRLECTNPLNSRTYNNDLEHEHHHIHPEFHHDFMDSRPTECDCLDKYVDPMNCMTVLNPKVQSLGLCINYERRVDPIDFKPGESISKFIDSKINQYDKSPALNNKIEIATKEAMKDITVDKIIGNKEMQFEDNNRNNIPDEYDFPENQSDEAEIIIGGDIGA